MSFILDIRNPVDKRQNKGHISSTMNLNIIKKEKNIKDEKGHKIVAAIYLVTNHLSDTDPLVVGLRSHAVVLLTAALHERDACAKILTQLLYSASTIGTISEKNTSIISYELQKFVTQEEEILGELFTTLPVLQKDIKRTFTPSTMSYKPASVERKNSDRSNDRSGRILSFMQEKKSSTIKDIAALFPGVSEKTIQRDLGALVQSGSLSKRGNKRWSVYFYEGPKAA